MVGEIRDGETAKTALEASLTGHLVLSTLHTNNAPESIVRLLEMGMNPFNFSDSLLGILAQRLVRCLCRKCRQPVVAKPSTQAKRHIIEKAPPSAPFDLALHEGMQTLKQGTAESTYEILSHT
jgi:type II secretory ATPase GspE/PulE/Tfp pilus assembly ATPase PilB-like protein